MIELRVRDLPADQFVRAGKVAARFLREYPDRKGFGQSVIYMAEGTDWPTFLVYRTKTAVVVRGA